MKILHATSELYPLIKTGGLADVLGALPFAQQKRGDDVRVVLPYYRKVREALPETIEIASRDTFGGYVTVRFTDFNGIGLYLVDAPHFFDREGNPYHDAHYTDYSDNVIRFGVLSWAAAALACGLDENWGKPEILHAHDWQTGLAPAYLKHWQSPVRSVFTIHNIAYQGMFQAKHLAELDLSASMYQVEGLEFNGQLSFLKAGLFYADHITTVSPTYAAEITQEPAACGLHGLLQTRHSEGRLSGILNGVDDAVWNPQHDKHLVKPYHLRAMQGKKVNKTAIQEQFGLPVDTDTLLLTMISRLTSQKGADLLLDALNRKLAEGAPLQFILLGSGVPGIEQAFKALAAAYPNQVAVHIGYDEELSHRLIAAADIILVPSRFEPCGLTQLYGLKYGTLPLVRKTGGLADTVVNSDNASIKNKTATGFVFEQVSSEALSNALNQAANLWGSRTWSSIRKQAMQQDFGWHIAAENYNKCYQQTC